MRILFLDDEACRHRHVQLRTKNTNADVFYAWDGIEAIKLLKKLEFDIIMLDHDLEFFPGKEILTGCDVARSIIELGDQHKKAMIVIHSLNPVGASNMTKTLDRAGFSVVQIPYAWQLLECRSGKWVIDTTKERGESKENV